MRAIFVVPLLLRCVLPAAAAEFEVRVTAPDTGVRTAAIATATVPEDFPNSGILKGQGAELRFQKDSSNTISFVLEDFRPAESRTFSVQSGLENTAASAQLEGGHVTLSVGGKHLLTYQGKETQLPRADIKPIFKRGGYLHPILSPSGKLLTDDYPPNHLHHHGIWAPWTKTVFQDRHPDFWNMGDGTGKVEFVRFGETWSGPVEAGFTAQHRFVDLSAGNPRIALNESWKITAFNIPNADYFVFDLVSTQTCATADALILPKYLYGGLGFRGNWNWNGEDKCHFLTANGETDRVKGNETRADWCHISGEVDGAIAGIAILSHPDNFRAPQPMRLHPKEPFFCFAPSQAGDWAIEPGKPYVARYRFIVEDGKPDKAQLDALWHAYAHPPQVTVTRKG